MRLNIDWLFAWRKDQASGHSLDPKKPFEAPTTNRPIAADPPRPPQSNRERTWV